MAVGGPVVETAMVWPMVLARPAETSLAVAAWATVFGYDWVRRVRASRVRRAGVYPTTGGTTAWRKIQMKKEIRMAGTVSRRQKNKRKMTAPKKVLKVIMMVVSEPRLEAPQAMPMDASR